MSEQQSGNLASKDPYVTSFNAAVQSVDGHNVVLDRTFFYAEGGGQPADRGTLAGVDVVDVQNRKGETVHTLAEIPAVEPGDSVTGSIDESFRTYTMRAHTASHVIYGAGRTLFDVQGYGGFDIAEDRIRIDFDTTDATDDVDPVTVERLVNEVIWDGRSVEWYEMDLETARTDEDIAFNLGDDAEPTDTVRIVEIDEWDRSACGGTHVENTVEIGPIAVLSVSNPGADLVRIEYAVGPSAIQHRVEERRAASRVAGMLDTSVENLTHRVDGLIDENETLRTEREQLSQQLLDTRISALAENTFVRNGDEWLVGTVDGVGPNDVADRIRTLELEGVDVIVLAGTDGSTFLVVGTDGEQDATEIMADVTDVFGGGGGGQPTVAQGGGLDADPQTVTEYVRKL